MADDNDGGGYPEPRFDVPTSRATSRRQFIKGVIASGAAVSSAGYLFTIAVARASRAPRAASSGCSSST